MTLPFNRTVTGLRWVLGLVVFWQAARFALSPSAAHEVARIGIPPWIPPVLGGSEALAALLFLVPAAAALGGYALLIIFAVAIGVHFLHGEYDVGPLLVYAMAVIVCLAHQNHQTLEPNRPHDR
jgi:hypothetical protein